MSTFLEIRNNSWGPLNRGPLFYMNIKDKYFIHTNDNDECLSVRCDFYQTCIKNSVSKFYKTKHKFEPNITEDYQCLSITSGKRSDMTDNNYPVSLVKIIE